MNSLPTIEGLTYSSTDVKNLYDHVVSDLKDFFTSYNAYVQCNSSQPATPCSKTDVQSKLDTVNSSLSQFNEAVAQRKENSNENTVDLENKLKKLRAEVDEKTKRLTDVSNSVNEDYIIKQQSYYYYNMVVSIFLACGIYYIFHWIDNKV
jgi:gas vesicle protein